MWAYYPETPESFAALAQSAIPEEGLKEIVFSTEEAPTDEQGSVMADALNVHEATGLTPSQLQARVAELEALLAAAGKVLERHQ